MQGLPEGHTEACYPVLRPGVDSHRAPPLKDSDADKREVCQTTHLITPASFTLLHACTPDDDIDHTNGSSIGDDIKINIGLVSWLSCTFCMPFL